MTGFRGAPAKEPEGPREITEDMRADADHAGRFLRLFGSIWMGVSAFTAVGLGLAAVATAKDPQTGANVRFLGLALGGCFFVFGLLVWLAGATLRRRALEVFERGLEARAVITEIFHDRRVRMNRKHPWRVRYSYLADGKTRTGTATFWTDHRPEGEVGDEVVALYVPGSPSRTVLWSRLGLAPSPRLRLDTGSSSAAESGELDAIAEDAALLESESSAERAANISDPLGDRDSDAKGSTSRSSSGG